MKLHELKAGDRFKTAYVDYNGDPCTYQTEGVFVRLEGKFAVIEVMEDPELNVILVAENADN